MESRAPAAAGSRALPPSPRLRAVGDATLRLDHRLGTPLPERVAVVRALPGIGDMLCAIPALRALRAALPRARVTLVGLASAAAVVERFPDYVDDLMVLPGYDGLDGRPAGAELPRFLAEAQRRSFDLAIQMHGSGRISNGLTLMLGARLRAGSYPAGDTCPDAQRFIPLDESLPEVRRLLRLVDFLGIPPQGEHLEFPVRPSDRAALAAIAATHELIPGRYVIVHPGSSTADRRWPPERFAAMANLLAALGLKVVLTGTADERLVVRAVAGTTRARAIDVSGQTTLGSLAALVEHARLVLCNDTGISHLADALRVPSVVVFTGSERRRWAPIDTSLHRAVEPSPGIEGIEDVLATTLSLLRNERGHAA